MNSAESTLLNKMVAFAGGQFSSLVSQEKKPITDKMFVYIT